MREQEHGIVLVIVTVSPSVWPSSVKSLPAFGLPLSILDRPSREERSVSYDNYLCLLVDVCSCRLASLFSCRAAETFYY